MRQIATEQVSSPATMSFADRFNFPGWNLIGWCVICGAWLVWEIWGATHQDAATFTYLIRSSVPKWVRWAAIVVLAWHFCFYDAPWWKAILKFIF